MNDTLQIITQAIKDSFKSQLGGHAIPGVPEHIDSWTTKGDIQSVDIELMAKAAIAAIADAPLDGDALYKAVEAYIDGGHEGRALEFAIKAYLTSLKEATCRT